MHNADRIAMPRENHIEWRRKQHKSNDLRGHKTGHGLLYHQYTTEMLSSQSDDAHTTLKPVVARNSHLGAVYKGRPANGEGGGVVLKFRTFPDGGRGGWFVKVRTSENF